MSYAASYCYSLPGFAAPPADAPARTSPEDVRRIVAAVLKRARRRARRRAGRPS